MTLPALTRPTLTNPLIFDLPATGFADTDNMQITIPSGRDAIIRSPHKKRVGHLQVKGGRNKMLCGYYTSIGKNRDGSYPADGFRGVGDKNIEIQDGDPGGIFHVEGWACDSSGGAESDGLMINAPNTIVQLLQCNVQGLLGALTGHRHADCMQIGPGGVRELRIDHCTFRSHYNNLYARRENSPLGNPIEAVKIRYTNCGGYTSNPLGAPQRTLRALSLGTQPADNDCNSRGQCGPANEASATNCELSGDVYLDHFYANYLEAGSKDAGQFVFPHDGSDMNAGCRAVVDAYGRVTWPAWVPGSASAHHVTGRVLSGPPRNGDWCKLATVGLAYTSAQWAP